jgi:hypothetical protein
MRSSWPASSPMRAHDIPPMSSIETRRCLRSSGEKLGTRAVVQARVSAVRERCPPKLWKIGRRAILARYEPRDGPEEVGWHRNPTRTSDRGRAGGGRPTYCGEECESLNTRSTADVSSTWRATGRKNLRRWHFGAMAETTTGRRRARSVAFAGGGRAVGSVLGVRLAALARTNPGGTLGGCRMASMAERG